MRKGIIYRLFIVERSDFLCILLIYCELPDFLRLKRFLLFIIHKIDTLFTRPHLDLI